MDEDQVQKMRARIEQCRRLAQSITDERTVKALNMLADEWEDDLRHAAEHQLNH